MNENHFFKKIKEFLPTELVDKPVEQKKKSQVHIGT